MATGLLNQTGASEELTRARLLEVLGRAASFQKDDVHLGYAEERMQIAARIYRAHEQWTWLSTLMTPLAMWVQVPRGAFDEAVRCLDEALALVPHHRMNRGVIHTFRAEVLDCIGRTDEAADSLLEAEQIAAAAPDARLRAYIEWDYARAASQRGDAAATVAAIQAVEALATEWFDQSGCMFLADAAEFLDRVGLVAEARGYLDRALAHQMRDEPALGRVEAGILARSGDPDDAERRLVAWLAAPWFEPRDEWRVCLLRAHAAARRGDANAIGLAVDAFALAAKLGYPLLPLIQERAIAEELLALAGGSDRFVSLNLDPEPFPIVISMLGRFEVTRGGRLLDVPAGQGRQLLKLIATAGGNLPAEQVIDELWPDIDVEVAANRLRTVLNRLRESVGDVVLRDDRVLRLAPHVRTDIERFEESARRAAGLGTGRSREALGVARSALAAYRGDLLPDDPYELWATGPRERLRRHGLSLLDLCATTVAAVGDLDEAVRYLIRATELAPYEEERYLTIAHHLLRQGRRGAARSYVDRARSVLTELNLSPPAALLDLDRLVRRV
jgi:DNA-binding SARP family transcriptional activator